MATPHRSEKQQQPKVQKTKSRMAEPGQTQVEPISAETAVDPSIQAQAARLGNSDLQGSQRQALAARIGQVQGNRHLQRVISSFKGNEDKGNEEAQPIQAQQSSGQPLQNNARTKMESLFGQEFSDVQVHTDAQAAELARSVDAEAVTMGEHIAFGAGSYQPGTFIGDALIAHELAHVAQQREATALPGDIQRVESESDALEADAKSSTIRAVASLWSGTKRSWTNFSQNVMPNLRSGLRLQRCSATQKKRYEDIKKILDTIPTGKEALALREKYDVKVEESSPGGGSYFDPSSNSMFIDPNHSNERAALAFVHEMNHARYHHEGLTADITALSRDEYIKKMVQEEAEGVIKSIEAKVELEGTKIDVSKTSYPLETEYRQAYKTAVDSAKVKDPKMSEEDLKKIGREAGQKRVIKGFMDGEVSTSNTKESYPDYYGKAWDKVNKKP